MTKLESEALQAMRKWAEADEQQKRTSLALLLGGRDAVLRASGDNLQALDELNAARRAALAAARKL